MSHYKSLQCPHAPVSEGHLRFCFIGEQVEARSMSHEVCTLILTVVTSGQTKVQRDLVPCLGRWPGFESTSLAIQIPNCRSVTSPGALGSDKGSSKGFAHNRDALILILHSHGLGCPQSLQSDLLPLLPSSGLTVLVISPQVSPNLSVLLIGKC